jgi:hydroxyacylglutathione hydrolase
MFRGTGYYKTKLIGRDIWSISGPANDQMYLAIGSRKAMLVDTGMGVGDLAEEVKKLTALQLVVVNTHGHPDHAGGSPNFAGVWLHPQDLDIMHAMCTDAYRLEDMKAFLGEQSPAYQRMVIGMVKYHQVKMEALKSNQVLDLGDRQFEVFETPGHTPGSVCLLNEKEKILFSGDTIVETPVWLYLKHSCPLNKYVESLTNIRGRSFETIYPGHLPAPLSRQNLEDLIACAADILAQPGIGKLEKTFAGEGLLWQHGRGTIIYNPDNL